jgi:CHASE1-domain containing sensor protein
VQLISLPFGGAGVVSSVFLGILLVTLILVVLALVGRRRQSRALAKRAAAGR